MTINVVDMLIQFRIKLLKFNKPITEFKKKNGDLMKF